MKNRLVPSGYAFIGLLSALASAGCTSARLPGAGTVVAQRAAASTARGALSAPKPVRLARSETHACAVDDHGRVLCWGDNLYGQAGPGRDHQSRPRPITGIARAVEVAVGDTFSCARLATGKVACWGQVPTARCGQSCLVELEGLDDAIGISAGAMGACAARKSGKVQCWAVGDEHGSKPYTLAKIDDAVSVSVGSTHACVLRDSGRVACWGQNDAGQLGGTSDWTHADPVAVPHVSGATHVASGANRSCAITAGGEVLCWGSGAPDTGLIGRLTPAQFGPAPWLEQEPEAASVRTRARRIEALSGSIALVIGGRSVCGIRSNGSVRCDGNDDISHTATRLTDVEQLAVSASGLAACAADRASTVRCWGRSQAAPESLVWPPARVADVSQSVDVAASGMFACALGQGGRVDCWGGVPGRFETEPWDESGRMLDAPRISASVRRFATLPKDTRSIATTGTTVCGVRASGQIACADAVPDPAVKLSPNLTGATAISAGSGIFCATQRTGGAQCWPALAAVARKFDDATDVTLEPAEVDDPCIVRSNGEVECWTTAQFLDARVPGTTISGVRDAVSVTGGGALACALERGGTVVCWNAAEPRPSEFDTVRVAYARSITAFNHGVCATTSTGQVLCHGLDASGHLERKPRVVFERGVLKLVSGGSYLCAQHDDGGVSCWGDNSLGQCGVSAAAADQPRTMLSLAARGK